MPAVRLKQRLRKHHCAAPYARTRRSRLRSDGTPAGFEVVVYAGAVARPSEQTFFERARIKQRADGWLLDAVHAFNRHGIAPILEEVVGGGYIFEAGCCFVGKHRYGYGELGFGQSTHKCFGIGIVVCWIYTAADECTDFPAFISATSVAIWLSIP